MSRQEKNGATLVRGVWIVLPCLSTVTGNQDGKSCRHITCLGPLSTLTHLVRQYCTKVRKDRAFGTLCSHGIFRAIREPLNAFASSKMCFRQAPKINNQAMPCQLFRVLVDKKAQSRFLIATLSSTPESFVLCKNCKGRVNRLTLKVEHNVNRTNLRSQVWMLFLAKSI